MTKSTMFPNNENYGAWNRADLIREIKLLQDAIRNHLVTEGFRDNEETFNWWVECNQPVNVITMKGDNDE